MKPDNLPHILFTTVLIMLLFLQNANACSPAFPNYMICEGDHYLLGAPIASFDAELQRLKPTVAPDFKHVNAADKYRWDSQAHAKATNDKEMEDLAQSLKQLRYGAAQEAKILQQYQTLREEISKYRVLMRSHKIAKDQQDDYRRTKKEIPQDLLENWKKQGIDPDNPPALPDTIVIPNNLPEEFCLYVQGALAYHALQTKSAAVYWKKLLLLPADKRHYRSVWAAYMLGRLYSESDPAQAVQYFTQTRKLAHEGFADSLGLAAASYGWQGRIALYTNKDYTEAIRLYLHQFNTGDKTAHESLCTTIKRSLNDQQYDLSLLVKKPFARKTMTAYLLSRHDEKNNKLWLKAIEKSGIHLTEEAARFCWLAYQTGDIPLCKRWLKVSNRQDIISRWIESKLLLREGKIDKGMAILAVLAGQFTQPSMPTTYQGDSKSIRWNDPEKQIRSELALLQLSRSQYIQSLDTLVAANSWLDAAYIAERLLTTQELVTYVDAHCPAQKDAASSQPDKPDVYNVTDSINDLRRNLRYLLARRLCREGKIRESIPYFPKEYHNNIVRYSECSKQIRVQNQPVRKRAAALWELAVITRRRGMELIGTELEPDWRCTEGSFSLTPYTKLRIKLRKDEKLAPPPSEEKQRISRNPPPVERFHYRYKAAIFAWRAARLMPNNDILTARMLLYAGYWFKKNDAKTADRFYKALVLRCGNTDLGKEADKLRWFPVREIKIEEEYQLVKKIAARQ